MSNYQSISQEGDDQPSTESDGLIQDTSPAAEDRSCRRVLVGTMVTIGLVLLSKYLGICHNSGHCASGVCCLGYVKILGRCNECCADPDCLALINNTPMPTEPGTFGEPFCVQNPVPLRRNFCSAFKNGKYSQIPEGVYPNWLPSETMDNSKEFRLREMPRVIYSDTPTPVYEQVWYFDFNDQDEGFDTNEVRYNDTHITLPSYEKLHAGYSRSYHMYDEHETGVTTSMTADNVFSMITSFPKVWFIEKYHTMTFSGIKDTARGDYVNEMSAKQMKEEPTWSRPDFVTRGVAQTAALILRDVVPSQIEAGVDAAIAWQLRRKAKSYPAEDIGSLNPKTSASWANHAKKAQQAIAYAKDPNFEREYIKSDQQCKHFEDEDGVGFDDNHVTFPIGKPITTSSGEMANSPDYYVGFAVGHTTHYYDEETNVYQIYYQSFSHSRQHSDARFPGPYKDGAYVSRVAEGDDYSIDKDGRTDRYIKLEQPPDDRTMITQDDVADFTLWARPTSEVCDPATLEEDFWEEFDISMCGGLFGLTPAVCDNFYDFLSQIKHGLQGSVSGITCAPAWMRSDYGKGSNGYSTNEISVWVHMISEVRDTKTKEMCLADWWNSQECFFQNKNPALCTTFG